MTQESYRGAYRSPGRAHEHKVLRPGTAVTGPGRPSEDEEARAARVTHRSGDTLKFLPRRRGSEGR